MTKVLKAVGEWVCRQWVGRCVGGFASGWVLVGVWVCRSECRWVGEVCMRRWVGKGHPTHFMRSSTWEFGQTPLTNQDAQTRNNIFVKICISNTLNDTSDRIKGEGWVYLSYLGPNLVLENLFKAQLISC